MLSLQLDHQPSDSTLYYTKASYKCKDHHLPFCQNQQIQMTGAVGLVLIFPPEDPGD